MDLLKEVCSLAVETGHYQAVQRKTFHMEAVESKHSHDYVSYVDKESERMIVTKLQKMLPEAGFITEEGTTKQNTGADYEWIVDPLDGTTNFIHDLGPWCVSIALRHGGELELGVVYEVTRDELFYATRSGGTWLRSADGSVRRLQVSSVDDVDQALFLIGYPYNADDYRDFSTRLTARLYGHCASVRSLGSAEATLCYVAAARLDIYVEAFLHPWDVCAGAVILKEAGGAITDFQGGWLWQDGREVLATNRHLHPAMLKTLRSEFP